MTYKDPDDFERGLSPVERLLWEALKMIGDGTLEVNSKLGRVRGAERVLSFVEEAERELGI